MIAEEVQLLVEEHFVDGMVSVSSEDDTHFHITVISDKFNNMRILQRQRMVYAAVAKQIRTGDVHSVIIKTYTNSEWNSNKDTEEENE